MKIETTECDCCDQLTHHIAVDPEALGTEGDEVFLSLTTDELEDLYLSCKEVLLHGDMLQQEPIDEAIEGFRKNLNRRFRG